MHHSLKRLTGISAIALLSAISGLAQDQQQPQASQPAQASQPGQASQPAPAQPQKKVKDQGEYDLFNSVTKETDPNKKLGLLNTWKEKYPDSDYKVERLQYLLATYQQLGKPDKMIDTAKEILAIDPKDIQALYWITFLSPSMGNNNADALALAGKAANGLLGAEKPAATKEEDWKKAKSDMDALAYKTQGWVAMVQKNNDEAEQNFKKSLSINPNAGEVSYWLGNVILAEKKPEKQSEALYDIARAAAFDGQGALNPQGRQQVDAYLTKAYGTLHGDQTGLKELKEQAKANPLPPEGFKIKTAAEVAAEKEEELNKTNPELALWMKLKGQLLSPEGQQYFDSSMKGAAVPKLKGWLVSAKPAVKSKELLVSMEAKDGAPDVTLKLVNSEMTPVALTGKPEVGTQIEFEGVGDSLSKEPFMVTFNVEKAKITGLKEDKVAAPARRAPVRRKK